MPTHSPTNPASALPSRAAIRTLRIDLLGPARVSRDGSDVSLSPLELNLLVILALNPGVTVSSDQLAEHLWGTSLPSSPRSRLQGLVSGLRRKVGGVLQTRYPGYLLDPAHVERDVDECEQLLAAARHANPGDRLPRLSAAHALWRGEPLAGVTSFGVAPERARLAEQRVHLLEARCEAELALGNYRTAAGLLASAVVENPFREHLAGLYAAALYLDNRQADALAVLQEVRERLATELGSELCGELRELQGQILRDEGRAVLAAPGGELAEPAPALAPPVVSPAATAGHVIPRPPARDGHFLGRSAELHLLSDALGTPPDQPGEPSREITLISGPGGLGKTSLLVEWAHQFGESFPDGQLFVDLEHGRRPPQHVLSEALTALGVAGDEVPPDVAARTRLFQALIDDRRLLLVAENAGFVEQVLALVPLGPGSRLVVTSRRRLPALAAYHAVREITLEPFDRETSRQLLHRISGARRLDCQATETLVEWCGGWPLLVRQAAARLSFRISQPIADFVHELESRPSPLLPDDPRSGDDALAAAHASLSPAAGRLFVGLSSLTGPLCLHRAADTAGVSSGRARELLDELTTVHLLAEESSGQFRLDPVVARFGRRLTSAQAGTPRGSYREAEPLPCREC